MFVGHDVVSQVTLLSVVHVVYYYTLWSYITYFNTNFDCDAWCQTFSSLNLVMAGRFNLNTCMCVDVFLSYPKLSYRVAQNDPWLVVDVTNSLFPVVSGCNYEYITGIYYVRWAGHGLLRECILSTYTNPVLKTDNTTSIITHVALSMYRWYVVELNVIMYSDAIDHVKHCTS